MGAAPRGRNIRQWQTGGVPLCAAIGIQYQGGIVSDGAGGALAAWMDSRAGSGDIYCQCVDREGRNGFLAPDTSAVRDIPGDQGAYYRTAYGKPVATLFDSTSVSDEYHYFQVVAHTSDPFVFWESEVGSGRSVDNLFPAAPLGLEELSRARAGAGETALPRRTYA